MAAGLVVEAVVLGVPDALLGNKLVVLVVAKNAEVNENTILSGCNERLPKYKMPASIKLIRTLPKNANGKVNKSKCLELI
jgi:acyl-CoA synthetase (AMP-forming)/AMP-acid ligase II